MQNCSHTITSERAGERLPAGVGVWVRSCEGRGYSEQTTVICGGVVPLASSR